MDAEFKFCLNDAAEAIITSYAGNGYDIIVPNIIENYPVKEIGRKAFIGNTSIKSILISEGIQIIGIHSFKD